MDKQITDQDVLSVLERYITNWVTAKRDLTTAQNALLDEALTERMLVLNDLDWEQNIQFDLTQDLTVTAAMNDFVSMMALAKLGEYVELVVAHNLQFKFQLELFGIIRDSLEHGITEARRLHENATDVVKDVYNQFMANVMKKIEADNAKKSQE